MMGAWPWRTGSRAPECWSQLHAGHPRPAVQGLSVLPSAPKACPGISAPGAGLAAAARREVARC